MLSVFARAVWPGAMVLCCGVCAAVSSIETGFWVCGSGGGSSRPSFMCKYVVQRGVAVDRFVRGLIASFCEGWPYLRYRFTTARITAALLSYRAVVAFTYRTY